MTGLYARGVQVYVYAPLTASVVDLPAHTDELPDTVNVGKAMTVSVLTSELVHPLAAVASIV